MNKKAEVEGFMPMVLVKLIFALVLILLITWLLVNLWLALFGNTNKTEKDNFETLFKLIESKSQTAKDYDSNKLTVYLIKTGMLTSDHTIHFFSDNKYIECGSDDIYRPTECGENDVSCLCLYDSDPDRGEDEKDDDVIACERFKGLFKISNEDYQLANYSDDCDRIIDNEYMKLIVGVDNSNNKKRIFVWEDTTENRALDEIMKKKLCPDKDTNSLCYGKKDSEIVTDFQKVNTECRKIDNTKAYFEATCTVEKDKCKVDCKGIDCASTTCYDFNVNKDFYVKGSKEEYFCTNNPCGTKCAGQIIEQYTCIKGKDKECKEFIEDKTIPGIIGNCSMIIGQYSDLLNNPKKYQDVKMTEVGDIIGFDSKSQHNTANIDCKSEIEKYFQKYNVLVCIPGKDCSQFVTTNPKPPQVIQDMLTNCNINPIKTSNNIIITQYNTCPGLENYFTEAYTCGLPNFQGGGGQFGGAGASGTVTP